GPPGGGGFGGPAGGGQPPGGGGFGGPPGGGGYGGPPGGGFGGPPAGGYGAPPPGGFGPPGGGFPPPGGPMGPGMGQDINTTLPLILSIVAAIFCCGISLILGIIGIVFSIQAGNAKKTGDIETARSKAKTATILAIAALVLGLVQNVTYAILNS
ncbi:MAG: CD225/dispanin family protein, partial [Polyangiaceae bacterium]